LNLLWEGINIQSPMNGNFDLSLIPVFLMDEANLVQNNHSSMSGNASLSGSIGIGSGSTMFNQKSLKYHSSVGSFGQYFNGFDYLTSSKKFYSRTRVFRTQAQYNYPILGYENTPFRKRQENNDFLSQGILQEFAFKLGSGILKFKTWLQSSDRGLSDAITVPNPKSRQQDQIGRLYLDYNCGKKNETYIKTAFFSEHITFTDNVSYLNKAQTFVLEIGRRQKFRNNIVMDFGINITLNRGEVEQYAVIRHQDLLSGFLSVHKEYKKVQVSASIRQQLHNYKMLLPAPSLGISSNVNNSTKVRFNTGFSYRVPTFNDLYWTPGGNIDLQNESAFKNEFGIDYSKKRIQISATAFHNDARNLIVWLPSIGGFWQAQNLRGARVLGTEVRINYSTKLSKSKQLKMGVFASLTKSTYSKMEAGNEDVIGNQLIFIPVEMGNVFVNLTVKSFEFSLVSNFTGDRFISTDNSSRLESYLLTNVILDYAWKIRKLKGRVGASANNITNTVYQLFPGRPMPGRSFQINLTINIYEKK